MELPDCPPGAEGYQDSVVEVAKKPSPGDCTKAEREFQEHLNSLKIKLENGETRCMVERCGRDVSGKWIYLCYPCAAMCSGESILQTHISGKKHKSMMAVRTVWPLKIFEEHPYHQKSKVKDGATEQVLQRMAEEVDFHNQTPSELDQKYAKYKNIDCHIQSILNNVKAPLIGIEYLVEHPPEEPHHEPFYMCALCNKQGHPRTIVNHMTCFYHRYNYIVRHFPKAAALLNPFRGQSKYRDGVNLIINRLAIRIEDKYGRLKPVHIDKEEYEKEKENILRWLFQSHHFTETSSCTFEEVVDSDLISSLHTDKQKMLPSNPRAVKAQFNKKDPSPPVVAAPSKPGYNKTRPTRRADRASAAVDSLSDVSDEEPKRDLGDERHPSDRSRGDRYGPRYAPYERSRLSPLRPRYAKNEPEEKTRRANYQYKLKLAEEKRISAEEAARKTLVYHEKNPEKHPLYPEEWKKFWNKRYKEVQAEGKDPSKHDYKPEWIVYWTARMKELHDEELRVIVAEIYRKLSLTPPNVDYMDDDKRKSPDNRRRTRSPPRRAVERRRSPEWRRTPDRRRSPNRRHDTRSNVPPPQKERGARGMRWSPPPTRETRSPERAVRRSPPRHRSIERRRSPPPARARSPIPRARSPVRTNFRLESPLRRSRSRSPLSQRDATRNRSPQRDATRNRSPALLGTAPSLQTVLISDDELKPDDALSPWNSNDEMDSLGSLPDARSPPRRSRSRTGSIMSRGRREYSRNSHNSHGSHGPHGPHGTQPQDLGPPENVVATLRLLVALEDYLGSLGPKIVDLLTDALRMEKEKANSSEELLVRDSAVVLMETAKEKLKGAVQAGLVSGAAVAAVRAAVVRVAATLHEADTRTKNAQKSKSSTAAPSNAAAAVSVAGVGSVDRAQIAQQMAAALIAQGKTDVSSEELAQLVDAVVGMAEAKKREADAKNKIEMQAASHMASSKPSGTASALQMLQSAYNENDKKAEKEDAPDAMDGLSDSDLETLLKNFNELSAEEQHSLIAYLKKLEAREPLRVERLRQYVTAAASIPAAQEDKPEKDIEEPIKSVTIESDDDDYTVEEVFNSVNQKVKEDQIRQEMEIVKKSLEERTVDEPESKPVKLTPVIDITKNLSSAANLLALVQASVQSAPAATPASNRNAQADVVASASQPRSFGDGPSAPLNEPIKQQTQNIPTLNQIQQSSPMSQMQQNPSMSQRPTNPPMNQMQQLPYNQQMDSQRPSFDQQMNYGGNTNDQYNQWGQNPTNIQNNRGPPMGGHGALMSNQGYPMGGQSNPIGSQGPLLDGRGPPMVGQGQPMGGQGHPMQSQVLPIQSQGPPMGGQGYDGYGQNNQYDNPGPHGGNFMNGRMIDNYDTRPNINQYGNNYNDQQQKNYNPRGGGRGRGQRGGRGRGRGYY